MWQAHPHELAQLRKVFRATLLPNNAERGAAHEFLAHAKTQALFENYLCQLLVHDSEATPDVRAAAGMNLKNSVLRDRLRPREFLKASVLMGLMLPETMVRNITGNVITSMFVALGTAGWPELLGQLLLVPESPDAPVACKEAAVQTLAKICEDNAVALDKECRGERPLDHVTARLLGLVQAPQATPQLRAAVVHCLNQLVPLKSPLVLVFLDRYLQALFGMASDTSAEVRKNVCAAFLGVMEAWPDRLLPHMDGVVSYCVHLMRDADEGVAIEACEFLLALSERPDEAGGPLLKAQLRAVLPVLLEKMVYSDEQIVLIDILDERDNAHDADRQEDVRPNMAKGKGVHSVSKRGTARKHPGEYDSDVSDSEGDAADDDSDDDDDDELNLWNLRRCAAATLDAVSLNHPQEVIETTLPILQETIVSSEWPVREAAILAFGAISKSCTELARDKLPTLVPFLVDRMKDAEPRVRQISCWTLSQYAAWICDEAHEGGQYASYFQHTFEAVVLLTLDPKKLVQHAACSSLSLFVEAADVSLIQYYVGPLLEHFAKCFLKYQRKNLIILYDSVSTFVERIGPAVFGLTPEHANVLLPPLLQNWQLLDDDDTDLWPLLECMSVVAATMGEAFAPYAMPVYERALKILANAIQLNQNVHTDPLIEAPEKDFMVASLDLIDGLVQGFKEHSVQMMSQHGANVMEPVLACLEDHEDDVRQLAYALLGDLAIFACEATIEPYIDRVVICIGNEINNYSYGTYPVTNNSVWAFGEIAIKANPESLKSYIPNVVNLLIPLLNSSNTHQTVLENAAICLGRLGVPGGALFIAHRLPEFIYSWCTQMMYVIENEEKESGFIGMIETLKSSPDASLGGLANPEGRKNLALFISCIGNYFEPLEALKELFFQTLMSYKEVVGHAWESQIMSLIDSETRGFLQSTYGI
ncbi:ARM repeat-containing protein [Metschnikowia bicuspidata var. bicuspidata NRRL YB-4993]|uniref:ARM repeat-containing protein n=1 Tax=Metschnikowia bicuspidata var. bicuspidata NRRL YB-4993 TaxID=869754 RepID=A0A1A0HK45_9ASCO|nr:ARM repeat-containing protein [Metschnikowia bicuspidata var. bicuspidata NRRL YB-4993]OBA24395.1 ARM repeat-containing protein [Metschnikowia bicuspidata var. bicuspidata NRRL YB-4993]